MDSFVLSGTEVAERRVQPAGVVPGFYVVFSCLREICGYFMRRLGTVSNVEFRITGEGRTIFERAAPYIYGWVADWNTRSVSQDAPPLTSGYVLLSRIPGVESSL